MKKKQEPAQSLLTIEPDRKFTLDEDGFIGSLYCPEQDCYSGKAIVLFGGSDGYFSLSCLIAEQFVMRGMTVLALAYWNQPGLPDTYAAVPIEPVERAAMWLTGNGYEKVGLWGISKGAELALLAGTKLTKYISCVIAVCPMHCCMQGIDAKKKRELPCSSWSYRGRELPYASVLTKKGRVLKDFLKYKEVHMRSCYEGTLTEAPRAALLPVEEIRGPILFLSADHDAMWPAKEAADLMMKRLRKQGFAYSYRHFHYEYASHFLIPYKLKSVKMFAIERQYPQKCMESNLDSFEKTLAFLKEW